MKKFRYNKVVASIGLIFICFFTYNAANTYQNKILLANELTNTISIDQQIQIYLPTIFCNIIISIILSVFFIKLYFKKDD